MPENATILRKPTELREHILRALLKQGGRANILHRHTRLAIYEQVAAAVGITEDEQQLKIADICPDIPEKRGKRNAWDYTMLVAVQCLKDDDHYIKMGMSRGIWELTETGMSRAKELMSK